MLEESMSHDQSGQTEPNEPDEGDGGEGGSETEGDESEN